MNGFLSKYYKKDGITYGKVTGDYTYYVDLTNWIIIPADENDNLEDLMDHFEMFSGTFAVDLERTKPNPSVIDEIKSLEEKRWNNNTVFYGFLKMRQS